MSRAVSSHVLTRRRVLERVNGLPDPHPSGFSVNCPSPVVAPNDFTG